MGSQKHKTLTNALVIGIQCKAVVANTGIVAQGIDTVGTHTITAVSLSWVQT